MRFVFISAMSRDPWGGSEELWSRAALRLCEMGHKVDASVAFRPSPSPRVTALTAAGINVHFYCSNQSRGFVRGWRKVLRQLGLPCSDLSWLRGRKPDLVVISMGGICDGLEWMKFCRSAGLPYVAISQCNSESWWPEDDLASRMAEAYLSAKRVFCVSKHNLALLERQLGTTLKNAAIVRNPYNLSPNSLPAWPKEDGTYKLACVARLDPAAKGQDLLFEVLSSSRWMERPLVVNLYGHGCAEGGLRRLASRLRLKSVSFKGHVDDVTQIWRNNSMLILPSRLEGTPLALAEAMWCGRPAIATDVGGISELCVDGETGFIASAPVVPILEETMERAWERRRDWFTMGEAARARADKLLPRDPVTDFCDQVANGL